MITFEGVHKTFRAKEGAVAAVEGVSFKVPPGAFFTLLGPSGCGKTTVLRLLAGLERPDRGRITIGDRPMFSVAQGIDVPAYRRGISMVFQSYAIWPHLSVFENVAYPLRVKRLARREVGTRVERMLELVGLGGSGSRPATRLSGGQQQRVALARALVGDPEVLLLDEPLSNLDAKLRAQMRIDLKELQARIGVTTVYVTHDQQEALALSDELVVMNAGEVVQAGRPKRVYHRPRNRFVAEFVGAANLLPGTAPSPLHDGINPIDTPLGRICAYVTGEFPPDRRHVLLSIRPESITLTKGNRREDRDLAAKANVMEGRIERLLFLGETTECKVRVRDSLLRVKGTIRRVHEGDTVLLHVPHIRCVVLEDELDGPPPGSTSA